MFVTSSLLLLGLATPDAHAATSGTGVLLIIGSNDILFRVSDGSGASSVKAEVESDAGSETVTLVESDVWLHGAAPITALPTKDASITLTLYDSTSVALTSFSGTLASDGRISLTPDDSALDIELLAAEVFATAGADYDLAFDLNGTDTYDVAYADISIVESNEVTTCEKGGECTTTGSSITTEAEVGWDDAGAIWTGSATLTHEGVIELKSTTYSAKGKKIDTTKAKLGAAWIDSGYGVNALATDEDPLTSIALVRQKFSSWDEPMEVPFVSVVSDGWSRGSTFPVDAQVELSNGETMLIGANSYQLAADPYVVTNPDRIDNFRVAVHGGWLSVNDSTTLALDDLGTPRCADGICVLVTENDSGEVVLSLTVYAADPNSLPTDAEVKIVYLDEDGAEVDAEYIYPHFQDDMKIVFAGEVDFDRDPLGLDLSGKVSLLGAANEKGKQKTLAKGKFYATVSRDADGDLGLGGADKDAGGTTSGVRSAAGGGTIELTDGDGNGDDDGPPVVLTKDKVSKEEAEAIKAQLVEAGATVEIR